VSLVYPGNQPSQACLYPAVAAVERLLGLLPAQRRRTVLRLDGGFGTDANLNWALWHGDQVLAKGYSGKRANAFARAVPQWEELRTGARWIAPAPMPLRYYRRTQTAVLKWKTEQDTYRHSLLISSLMEPSLAALAEAYDDRAAIAAELKADKGGLQLHRRRKQRLAAREALVLLTDLAHNLLAWTREWILRDSPFADAGLYRMVKELLPIPGKVVVAEGQSMKLRLKASHPLAKPMLACLTRLFDRFGTPGILRKS
jgi:Transposase DDE domain group 1